MVYKIHNPDAIEPTDQQPFVEEEVKRNHVHFEKFLRNYPKQLLLEIFIKNDGKKEHIVIASLTMHSKNIIAEERGMDAVTVVSNALEHLRNLVKKQLQVERKEYLHSRRNKYYIDVQHSQTRLEGKVKKDDKDGFIHVAKKILPELQKHIKKQVLRKWALSLLVKKGVIGLEDIEDEVYVALYDEFQNNPDASEKIILSALAVADKKIKELNDNYSMQFVEVISTEKLTQKEYDELNEELTATVDFKPALVNEVEENFFAPGKYNLHEILTDAGAEEEIINQVEPYERRIDIATILQKFGEEQQSVFELHYLYRLSPGEIADIKSIKKSEVEQTLKEIRLHIADQLIIKV
jgi:RNA polymerase sigma factor (sigma-70 family)